MFEVLKNAMRAVVEFTGPDGDLPDLKVFVVHGKEDIAIKVIEIFLIVFRRVFSNLPLYWFWRFVTEVEVWLVAPWTVYLTTCTPQHRLLVEMDPKLH